MLCTLSHLDAAIAGHAMAVVDAQTAPHTTDVAVWTVIDALRLAVVPELADVAEILPKNAPSGLVEGTILFSPVATARGSSIRTLGCLGDGTGKRRRGKRRMRRR